MSLNEFFDLMACIREETEKFCRGRRPAYHELESLGWALTSKYHHPKTGYLFDILVVKYVIEYGEG